VEARNKQTYASAHLVVASNFYTKRLALSTSFRKLGVVSVGVATAFVTARDALSSFASAYLQDSARLKIKQRAHVKL
jgi:hypothetical protein